MITQGLVWRLGLSQLLCWGLSYYLIGVLGERIAADRVWTPEGTVPRSPAGGPARSRAPGVITLKSLPEFLGGQSRSAAGVTSLCGMRRSTPRQSLLSEALSQPLPEGDPLVCYPIVALVCYPIVE